MSTQAGDDLGIFLGEVILLSGIGLNVIQALPVGIHQTPALGHHNGVLVGL